MFPLSPGMSYGYLTLGSLIASDASLLRSRGFPGEDRKGTFAGVTEMALEGG